MRCPGEPVVDLGFERDSADMYLSGPCWSGSRSSSIYCSTCAVVKEPEQARSFAPAFFQEVPGQCPPWSPPFSLLGGRFNSVPKRDPWISRSHNRTQSTSFKNTVQALERTVPITWAIAALPSRLKPKIQITLQVGRLVAPTSPRAPVPQADGVAEALKRTVDPTQLGGCTQCARGT